MLSHIEIRSNKEGYIIENISNEELAALKNAVFSCHLPDSRELSRLRAKLALFNFDLPF